MKILVIGGTGFIGRHLCPFLAKEHEVVVMSRNPPAAKNGLKDHDNISYRQGDVTNRVHVFAAVEGMDYVVNLASTVIPSTSNLDPVYDVQSNLVGAINILDAAVEHKIKKLVFISSGGTVYGEGTGKPFKETDPTNPVCSYGIVKLAIEKYIQMYHRLYGLPYAILRVSNPYGPGQISDKPQGVISIFANRVVSREQIEIWGDGTVSRDFIYVEDLVYGIVMALSKRAPSLIINIGSGRADSLNEIVWVLGTELGITPHVIFRKMRAFDVRHSCLDISEAVEQFGWKPSVALRAGIRKLISENSF